MVISVEDLGKAITNLCNKNLVHVKNKINNYYETLTPFNVQ